MGLLAVAAASPLVANGAELFPGSSSGSAPTADTIGKAASVDTRQLVVNGGFEDGLTGWRVNNPRTTALLHTRGGRSGQASAVLRATHADTVTLNDAVNTVALTEAGVTYQASAFVKASKPGLNALLRLREVTSGQLINSDGAMAQLTTQWKPLTLTFVTKSAGAHLDLNIIGWKLPKDASIMIDDVSLRRIANPPVSGQATPPTNLPAGSPTTSASPSTQQPGSPFATEQSPLASSQPAVPSSPAPSSDGQPAPPSITRSPTITPPGGSSAGDCVTARGIPTCGGTFLGAAIGGNDDPAAKESQFGSKIALRRTFYQGGQVASAVKNAQADIASGRIPWISFKMPHSWADMANGKGDAWAKDLAVTLDKLNGPVWLALHHEPEGDGDIKEWVRMQARLSPIIRNNADNVAFTIILTGWNQVFANNPQYSFQAMWPGDGLVDILAIDPYNDYGVVKNGKTITTSTELKDYYAPLASFAKARGTRWAVAETGYTDLQAARDPAWLNRAYQDMQAMGGVGLSYFDSHLNAYGTWRLETPEKIEAFRRALVETTRLHR